MHKSRSFILACGLALAPTTWATGAPALGPPIDCAVPSECIIQNYVDTEPGPDYRDHACQRLSYDGHKGTDFRVKTASEFQRGVIVQAAADGTVRAIRNDMPDVPPGAGPPPGIDGREAGNAVAIRHGEGWETQYSHLRRSSVRVRPGQEVRKGQPLGVVGLSGNTEFPHLHFAVRRQGKTVDPFTGLPLEAGCGRQSTTLWDDGTQQQFTYRATGELGAGFTDRSPNNTAYKGFPTLMDKLPDHARAVVFWIKLFGLQSGDRLELEVIGPQGKTLARQTTTLHKAKAQYFAFVGKKRRGRESWPRGTYRGRYRLYRNDQGQTAKVLANTRILRMESHKR